MLDVPSGKNVVVLASYQTGSTALCDTIAVKYGLRNFDEVFHPQLPARMGGFLDFRQAGGQYVIKIMPDHVTDDNRELIETLLAEAYVIKIRRQDVNAQHASFYICHTIARWHQKTGELVSDYDVAIDYTELDNTIKYLDEVNSKLDFVFSRVDADILYEELDSLESNYERFRKPRNYSELTEAIGKLRSHTVVNIPNVDSHVWDFEHQVVNILYSLTKTGAVTIHMDSEGPDLHCSGVYQMLDKICDTFGFSRKSITIHTRNILESHPCYNIKNIPPVNFASQAKRFASEHEFLEKDFSSIKHFGVFIGRSNWQRLYIASTLYKKYKDKSLITYHYDAFNGQQGVHLGFDELSKAVGAKMASDLTGDLLSNLPLVNDVIDSYPILSPVHNNISKVYHRIFVDVVCESFTSGRTFFSTEKTWRPIITKTPFMINGPAGYLNNLQKMGFKTFGDWWDESYDEIGGMYSLGIITKNFEILSKKSASELQTMYNDMLPVLEHNLEVFMQLDKNSWGKLTQI